MYVGAAICSSDEIIEGKQAGSEINIIIGLRALSFHSRIISMFVLNPAGTRSRANDGSFFLHSIGEARASFFLQDCRK